MCRVYLKGQFTSLQVPGSQVRAEVGWERAGSKQWVTFRDYKLRETTECSSSALLCIQKVLHKVSIMDAE